MDEPIRVLAGTGGVALGEARTNHFGRRAVLLHRDGNPKELITAVLFICSDKSTFLTGSEIAVDGGFGAIKDGDFEIN